MILTTQMTADSKDILIKRWSFQTVADSNEGQLKPQPTQSLKRFKLLKRRTTEMILTI